MLLFLFLSCFQMLSHDYIITTIITMKKKTYEVDVNFIWVMYKLANKHLKLYFKPQ